MARIPQSGTPKEARAKQFVFPSRSRRLLWASLLLGVASVFALVVGYAAGVRRTLSPGDVAEHHARIDLKCSQCHEPGRDIAAVRCERCHDPRGSDRLAHAAHVLLGTADLRAAEGAPQMACATCHREHRGREAAIAAVDDRECVACHTNFPSLARHPRFAVEEAGATAGVGFQFTHAAHFDASKVNRQLDCADCHQQTQDRRTFVPINYDLHCGSCHTRLTAEKDTDGVLPELLVPPSDLPGSVRSTVKLRPAPNPRKMLASGAQHRDPWITFNALRLGQSIDRDAFATERLVLRGRIEYLQQLVNARPVTTANPEELEQAQRILQTEIADLDARLAAPAMPAADALRTLTVATQSLARQLKGIDPELGGELEQSINSAAAETATELPSEPPADITTRFDQRREELKKLLETLENRGLEERVKARVVDLRSRIDALRAPAAAGGAEDTQPLLDQLRALDQLIVALRDIPDPGIQSQVTDLEVLRAYGQQRVAAGVSPADFERRKAELLALLDVIEQRGGAAVGIRTAALRRRVLAVRPGTSGVDELLRDRRQRQKQLDRIALELVLQRSGDAGEQPSSQDAAVGSAELTNTLERLRARLADLDRAPRMSAAESSDDRAQRRTALRALLLPCLNCHELDAAGVRLAPVRIAEPVMPRAIFNHAPHTTQTTCDTCHGSARTSRFATDVNVPGVANCQQCHRPSQVRATCATCHEYHPASPAKLLMVTR